MVTFTKARVKLENTYIIKRLANNVYYYILNRTNKKKHVISLLTISKSLNCHSNAHKYNTLNYITDGNSTVVLETLKSPSNLQITILLDGLPSLGHLGAGRGTTAYAAAPDGKAEWCLSSSSPDTKHTVLRGPAGLPLPEHQLSTLGPSIRPIYIYRLQTESRVMKTQSCLKDR